MEKEASERAPSKMTIASTMMVMRAPRPPCFGAPRSMRARVCHPQDAEGDESGGQQRRKSVGQHGEPGVDLAQLFPPLIFDGEGSQRARSQQDDNSEHNDGDARAAASMFRSAAVNAVLSHARSVAPGVVGQASRPVRCATCVLDNMNALFEYSERPSPIGARSKR